MSWRASFQARRAFWELPTQVLDSEFVSKSQRNPLRLIEPAHISNGSIQKVVEVLFERQPIMHPMTQPGTDLHRHERDIAGNNV